MASTKKRYNWKARQSSRITSRRRDTTYDTNIIELPVSKDHSTNDATTPTNNRKYKKLNSKQRKRLQKIIDTKERKEKRAAVIKSLQTLALPSSKMSLFHSSSSLTKKRPTRKEVLARAQSTHLVNTEDHLIRTTWRRKKRKKLCIEKILSDPPRQQSSESNEEEIEENEEIDLTNNKEVGLEDSKGVELKVIKEGDFKDDNTDESPVQEMELSPSEVNIVPNDSSKVKSCNPALYLPVNRTAEIEESRLSLPILSEEHHIMEYIHDNPIVIICGETGSGKTTQVPQFLYEAGYTMKGSSNIIGISEPRRLAAVTMSQRVAQEMNLTNDEVSYQIRYEGNVTSKTRIKFMTDGVLLKEIEKDFYLSSYSVIIVDEAHERSTYTDVLIGLLSRIVPLRYKNGCPLKLVIMSATLRVEDFTQNKILFPAPPPVIKVESRQYPVTVHFNRHTPDNYVSAAYYKVLKIHQSLPNGHILVFVTGKQEIYQLCAKLKRSFPCKGNEMTSSKSELCNSESCDDDSGYKVKKKGNIKHSNDIDLNNYPSFPQPIYIEDEEWTVDLEEESENEHDYNEGVEPVMSSSPLLVLPLYATLSPDQQFLVFSRPLDGVRMCVISTNVAETSVTIPNIKYVVDSGKVKQKYYDKLTGISTFRIEWISKSSADQRAGRAGRTEPGHCYRLYSSSIFHNEFPDFSRPEITERPVDDLVLQMKAMNIVKVINFPFPTPPSQDALRAAEKLLIQLGALVQVTTAISPLGQTMASLPVAPRYAKMLALAHQYDCLPYMVILVSALSVRELFVTSDETTPHLIDKIAVIKRAWVGQGEWSLLGDLMILLRAVGAYELADNKISFCSKFGLRLKAFNEIGKLRQQLTNIINGLSSNSDLHLDPKMAPPTQQQAKFLRQIVLTGSGNNVARKINTNAMNSEDKKKYRYAYQCMLCEGPVYLHPTSSLLQIIPQYVVFQELVETRKLYMRDVCVIEEEWLPVLLPNLCTFSQPLDTPPPIFDHVTGIVKCHMTCSFGLWSMSPQLLPYPQCLERYKWFAVFLLKGEVIPILSQFTSSLLSPPITMIKPWAKLQQRTQILLSALVAKEVSSRDQLLTSWKEDPQYLLAAFSMWLPQKKHNDLSKIWPPL